MSSQTHSEALTGRKPPEPIQRPNANHTAWLLRRVWSRVNERNMHFMGCVVGAEGSGKSFSAIKIANNVDETFSHERVIFDVAELLETLGEGDHDPGDFYVLDEAGVQLGKRTWQDRAQVLANQALQLVRSHNLGLIFTLPRLSELDSQAEGRLQAVIELNEKRDGEYVGGPWLFIDPDRRNQTGKIYQKMPRREQNGIKKKITGVRFTPPDPEVIEPYEAKKREFQEEFYAETIQQLRGEDEEGGDEDAEDLSTIAAQIANEGMQHVVGEDGRSGDPIIKQDLIRAHFDTTVRDARAIKAVLEKQFDTSDLEEIVA